MATLFTSTYESVHQLSMRPERRTDYSVLDSEYLTVAEYFQNRGYRTAAISAQPWVAEQTGFRQGFDEFAVVSETTDPYSSEVVAMNAIEWLRRHDDEPFFLYLHLMSPHTPYDPPDPFSRLPWVREAPDKFKAVEGRPQGEIWDFIRSLEETGPNRATSADIEYLLSVYDAEIAHADYWIGALHREMERLGLIDDSLIVLTSDHGESFFEHGRFLHITHIYNENLHVPLIFSNPRLFPEQRRLGRLVGLIDVFPTLVDVYGGDSLDQFQGQSILSTIPREELYAERRRHEDDGRVTSQEKVQSSKWSLIANGLLGKGVDSLGAGESEYELYQIAIDPGESTNVLKREPDAVADMIDVLMKTRAANMTSDYRFESKTTELDQEMLEQLRSLGYID